MSDIAETDGADERSADPDLLKRMIDILAIRGPDMMEG